MAAALVRQEDPRLSKIGRRFGETISADSGAAIERVQR
jgi:hypothetical protein